MKPGGSMPHSQGLSNNPESTQFPAMIPIFSMSILILSSHLRLGLYHNLPYLFLHFPFGTLVDVSHNYNLIYHNACSITLSNTAFVTCFIMSYIEFQYLGQGVESLTFERKVIYVLLLRSTSIYLCMINYCS